MVAVALLMLVSAIGLSLVASTRIEPAMALSFEATAAALYAADAGLAVAVHELGLMGEWDAVLRGERRSALLDPNPAARLPLPDGSVADVRALTNVAACGHAETCTSAELDAFSADRPWGPNNPRWQVFGSGRVDQLVVAGGTLAPCAVVVWAADDPAETDGNPLKDSLVLPGGIRQPGAGTILLRADGFAVRSARRTVLATVQRPRWAGDGRRPVVAWRDVR